MDKKKLSENSRHPSEEKVSNSDTHPPLFPMENKRMALVRYISELRGNPLNIKAYSRTFKVARSSIYTILEWLLQKSIITKNQFGNYVLTSKGNELLGVSESVRWGCRKEGEINQLSTHYLCYSMVITNKENFSEERLRKNYQNWKPLHLPNLKIYYIYLEESTIIIKPKKVEIRIHDQIKEEDSFSQAVHLFQELKKIGIIGENIYLEPAHYARIKSLLSEALEKRYDKYYLDLGNGEKFWIDHSNNASEDETNSEESRERLDTFIVDMFHSNSLMSDVDKMKEVMGALIKLKIMDNVDVFHKDKKEEQIKPYYCG